MKDWNRRDFFKQLTYGGAAIAFIPATFSSCQQGLLAGDKNCIDLDGILPLSFINDCAQLILQIGRLSQSSQEALTADIHLDLPGNMSRLSPAMSFPDEKILELLQKVKHNWESRTPEMRLEHRYSLFLGWIIYSGFQHETGKLYHKLIDNGYHYDDIRICHDTFIFTEISGKLATGPKPTREELAELFNIMLPRMVTRLHTFKPDTQDGKQWVMDMTNWRKANKALMDKYAAELVNPDQENIDKFIRQPGFYAGDDKIIQLARKIQNGIHVSAEEISSTLKSDSGNSLYAKSLDNGIKKAELTDQYFTDNLSFSDLSHQIAAI